MQRSNLTKQRDFGPASRPLYHFSGSSADTIDRLLRDQDQHEYEHEHEHERVSERQSGRRGKAVVDNQKPHGRSYIKEPSDRSATLTPPPVHSHGGSGSSSGSSKPIRRHSPTESFKDMLDQKWRAACEALEHYKIEEALRRMRDLLASCMQEGYQHPSAGLLCANVGILHWHLGELDNAQRYLLAAVEQAPNLAIHRFLYGCVSFELGEWQQAWGAFEGCLGMFPPGAETADCGGLGLEWVLERAWVEENCVKAEAKCRFDDGMVVGAWRMQGLKMFEPTK